MKNHWIINRSSFKSIFILAIGLIIFSVKMTFAQTNPSNQQTTPTQQNPNPPTQTTPATPQTMPMDTPPGAHPKAYPSDTSKSMKYTKENPTPQGKLTQDQIKRIVGNDKPAGKDAVGHDLYMDSQGRKYYVGDDGTKVYVK